MTRRSWVLLSIGSCFGLALAIACQTGDPAQPSRGPIGGGRDGSTTVPGDASSDARACIPPPIPDGGPATVKGIVVQAPPQDAAADAAPTPVPFALLAVEYGGRYVDYCDYTRASPYYVFGGQADDAGTFSLPVKQGVLGFHAFAKGFLYSGSAPAVDTTQDASVWIPMQPWPADAAVPIVLDAGFDKTTVEAGAPLTFFADLSQNGHPELGPMSDEAFVIELGQSWCRELDPPEGGTLKDFPYGVFKRTFNAPSTPGTYVYHFVATTESCIVTDPLTFTLTVQ